MRLVRLADREEAELLARGARTVNFATETASIAFSDTIGVADLIGTVEGTGYTAAVPDLLDQTRQRLT